jgi:cyclophilin family peptidyl-prolyl cis-trans isomerase
MAQGGDFSLRNGSGGESVFGGKFPDENFIKKHTKAGLLSMANAGPNTNGSQFFITFRATPHLNGKHTVFGELVEGADLLRRIEAVSTGERDKPVFGEEVRIDDCGEVRASVASTPGAPSISAVDAGRSSDHPDSRGQKSSKKHKRDPSEERERIDHDRRKRKKHKKEKKSKKERRQDRSRSRSRSPKRSRDHR